MQTPWYHTSKLPVHFSGQSLPSLRNENCQLERVHCPCKLHLVFTCFKLFINSLKNMAQQGIQSLKDLTGGKMFFIFFVVPTFLGQYLGFQNSKEIKCNLRISICQSNSFSEQNSKNHNQFSFCCLTLFHKYQSQQFFLNQA